MSDRVEQAAETCETCLWWYFSEPDTDNNGVDVGQCRRFPPLFAPSVIGHPDKDQVLNRFAAGNVFNYRHPLTMSNDWCGEWKIDDDFPTVATPAPPVG
jgi:hypothetical protein